MKRICKLEQLLPAGLRRRATAASLTAIMALASVFGIGGAKLKGYESSVAKRFSVGEYSIAADLNGRLDAAANLISHAQRVDGVSEQALTQAQNAIRGVQKASGPAATARADKLLAAALNDLYDEASGLAGQIEWDLMAGQLSEFDSKGVVIHNNDYNFSAEQFNQDSGSFPANLIGLLWGVDEAEYYE